MGLPKQYVETQDKDNKDMQTGTGLMMCCMSVHNQVLTVSKLKEKIGFPTGWKGGGRLVSVVIGPLENPIIGVVFKLPPMVTVDRSVRGRIARLMPFWKPGLVMATENVPKLRPWTKVQALRSITALSSITASTCFEGTCMQS